MATILEAVAPSVCKPEMNVGMAISLPRSDWDDVVWLAPVLQRAILRADPNVDPLSIQWRCYAAPD